MQERFFTLCNYYSTIILNILIIMAYAHYSQNKNGVVPVAGEYSLRTAASMTPSDIGILSTLSIQVAFISNIRIEDIMHFI